MGWGGVMFTFRGLGNMVDATPIVTVDLVTVICSQVWVKLVKSCTDSL